MALDSYRSSFHLLRTSYCGKKMVAHESHQFIRLKDKEKSNLKYLQLEYTKKPIKITQGITKIQRNCSCWLQKPWWSIVDPFLCQKMDLHQRHYFTGVKKVKKNKVFKVAIQINKKKQGKTKKFIITKKLLQIVIEAPVIC